MACASACRSYEDILEEEPLRFEIGDSVMVKVSHSAWQDGEIVKRWWRHPVKCMYYPYQVRLRSEQKLIYIPVDDDDRVRKIGRFWLETLGGKDEFSDEEMHAVRMLSGSKENISDAQQQLQAMVKEMRSQQHRNYCKRVPQQGDGANANKKLRPLHPLGKYGHNSTEDMWSTDGWANSCSDCDCGDDHGGGFHGEGHGHGHGGLGHGHGGWGHR
eukprot:CAMPEP_0172885142 /NCGR_PEP_ID=MMETSP1075-20121228/127180_1 /TAXON_ID=2916 /ORGANISM="Ceratium fusus, Strain PA161109" /LENGTH=214 /DNA_ID=CAMNT_0013738369 /DNA_START=1 /DNA_END=645 /DNA_ORIENTATION=-